MEDEKHGDFAEGEEEEGHEHHEGSFAEGQSEEHGHAEEGKHGDFAEGRRRLRQDASRGVPTTRARARDTTTTGSNRCRLGAILAT